MEENIVQKYLKPIVIIILLYFMAFYVRSEASELNAIPEEMRDLYKDPTGLPYFSEMDSYYNFRLTENYVKHGYLGDTKLANGTEWDWHSYSGREADYPPLIAYTTSLLYSIAQLFGITSLRYVAFWTSALIGSLCVIPCYLFIRRVSNDYGGIAAGLIVAMAPTYFTRTYAGFFDTDMFNVLLPVLAIWLFTESILNDDLVKRVILAILSALTLILFSMAWTGYIFYAGVIVIFAVVYFIFSLILPQFATSEEYYGILGWMLNKRGLFSMIILLVVILGIVTVTGNINSIIDNMLSIIDVYNIDALKPSTWPNVYVSVSELQNAQFSLDGIGFGRNILPNTNTVVGGVGVAVVLVFGIFGILGLLWKLGTITNTIKVENADFKENEKKIGKQKNTKEKYNVIHLNKHDVFTKRHKTFVYTILFYVWIIAAFIAVLKGTRFIAVLGIPIGLSAGLFVGEIADYLKEHKQNKELLWLITSTCAVLSLYSITYVNQFPDYYAIVGGVLIASLIYIISDHMKTTLTILMLLAVTVVPSVIVANELANNGVAPGADDNMYDSMVWVKKNTPNNTVMMSWWDFGHLFTQVGDRATTFDGGTQNTPRAYWIGRALSTSNESLSNGIMQMLASSGDKAHEELGKYNDNNTEKSVKILNNILGLSRSEAKELMTSKYSLSSKEADNVLKYSHPSKEVPYVLVLSSDMLPKATWWSYFGSWDFDKQNGTHTTYYPYTQTTKPTKINGSTVVETINLNETTAGGSAIMGTIIKLVGEKKANVSNINTTDVKIYITQQAAGGKAETEEQKPYKLIYLDAEYNTMETKIVDKDSKLSVLLISRENNTFETVVIDKGLEESVFTKLYLTGGANQTTFRPVHQENSVSLWTFNNSNVKSDKKQFNTQNNG